MAGYTRQSAASIVTGGTITAADFNDEFNQIQTAFNSTSTQAEQILNLELYWMVVSL